MGWLYRPCIAWEPIRETSSHATRQGTLDHSRVSMLRADPGLESGNCAHEVISKQNKTKQQQKREGGEWLVEPSLRISTREESDTHSLHRGCSVWNETKTGDVVSYRPAQIVQRVLAANNNDTVAKLNCTLITNCTHFIQIITKITNLARLTDVAFICFVDIERPEYSPRKSRISRRY